MAWSPLVGRVIGHLQVWRDQVERSAGGGLVGAGQVGGGDRGRAFLRSNMGDSTTRRHVLRWQSGQAWGINEVSRCRVDGQGWVALARGASV